MVSVCPAGAVNCPKRLVPMPTMTASTRILMPEETTLPSTRSARKAVLFQSAKGTSTKPASVVSLNSISVTKSCTARMKKLSDHEQPREPEHGDRIEVGEDVREADEIAHLRKDRLAGRDPDCRKLSGLQQIGRGERRARRGETEPRERVARGCSRAS